MNIRQLQLLLVAIFVAAVFYPTPVECKALDREAMDPLQTISDFAGYKRQYTISPQGIYTFYYVLPQSSRFEERTASGEVRGNYAYIAPEGEQFKFKYEAGKKGFQVESNALPSAPEDTDEVKKAKEVFFEAYQQALALAELEEKVKGKNKARTDVHRGKAISRIRVNVGDGDERGEVENGKEDEEEDQDESNEDDDEEESSEESSEEDDEDDESSEEDDDESSEEDDDESSEEDDDDDESSEEDDDNESSEEDDDDDESDEDVRKSLNIRGRLNHNKQIYNAPRRRRLIRIQHPQLQKILSHIHKSSNQNQQPENKHSNIRQSTAATQRQRQNTGTTHDLNKPQTSPNLLQNPPLRIAENSYFIRNSKRNPPGSSRPNLTGKRRVNSTPDLTHDSSRRRNPNPNNRIHNTIERHLNRNPTSSANRQFNRPHRRKVLPSHAGSARLRISRQPMTRSGIRPTIRFTPSP